MNEYNTEEFRRASALAMANCHEMNAKSLEKLGMISEAKTNRDKARMIRNKWEVK